MKANLLKLISILCVLCMLVAVFASCAQTPDTETKSETKKETTAETSKETAKETTGESDTEKETVKETEKETEKETVKETVKETEKETEKETVKETEKETVKETEPETERETLNLKAETVISGFSDAVFELVYSDSYISNGGKEEGNPNPQFQTDGSITAEGKSPFRVISKDSYSFENGFKVTYTARTNDLNASGTVYWGTYYTLEIGDFMFAMKHPFHEWYNGAAPVILQIFSNGEYIDRFVVEGDLIAECYTDAWAHNGTLFDDVEGYINGTWTIDFKDGYVTVTNGMHGVVEWEMWDGSTATTLDFGVRGFSDTKIEFIKSFGGCDDMGKYTAFADLTIEKYVPAE